MQGGRFAVRWGRRLVFGFAAIGMGIMILLALILGCLYGSVIHIIRMKISDEGSVLAMGPYLSAGILTAMWFGTPILEWYAGFFDV